MVTDFLTSFTAEMAEMSSVGGMEILMSPLT